MQKKLIRIDNKVIILLPETSDYIEYVLEDEDEYQAIQNAESVEDIQRIIHKDYDKILNEQAVTLEVLEKIKNSEYLIQKGECIYLKDTPTVSIPMSLAIKVLEAEEKNDTVKLETYKNFWTLMSLNPDESCRKNLFWFLDKHGIQLSRSGFFIGYRNVDRTNEEGVYTDHHTHTFRIKIGEMVTMPREECDCCQENQCSTGLHLSNRDWLTEGYYGEVGLTCLCNPADVCCVPYDSEYGKLRTCAYMPIALTKYDYKGNVIPFDKEDGFESKYVVKAIYEGLSPYADKEFCYRIEIPNIIGFDKPSIEKSLYTIAMNTLMNRCR